MASIKDVARLAGVTHTTVSHALSGKRHVAPATCEAIFAAVRQLDYRPNANALSLAARRTRRICLAVPLDDPQRTLSKGPAFDFIAGVADRLSHHGYTLVCEISHGLDAEGMLDLVRASHVDGTLLLGTQLSDPRVDALRKARSPFVTFGRTRAPAQFVRVDADAAGAASLAARHLFALGHRHIALVLPTSNGEPVLGSHFHALAGFKRAHRDYGLPLRRAQIITYDSAAGLGDRVAPLTDGTLDVSAVIAAGNDLEAVTVLRAVTARGRRVPDDLSLVGLVDSPLTQLAQPPITVTDLPVTAMCSLAVDLLVELIDGRKPRRMEHLLPVTLLERPSTRRVGPALSPLRPAAAPAPASGEA